MSRSGLGDGALSFVYASRGNQFKLLFSVTVTHTYYTQDDGLCPDFRVVPTRATAKLMATLGLAFQNDAAGFSVYYQTGMLSGIVDYIRREAADAPTDHPGFWSRLTFLMQVVNPEFLGITALPMWVTPVKFNLYGCNRDAHFEDHDQEGAPATLSRGEFMGRDALYGLIGNELDLAVPDETCRVTVTDISGAIVLAWPQKPEDLFLERGSGPSATKHVIIDLSTLPHDLYTIALEDSESRPIVVAPYPRTELYVPANGGSTMLLDMLFTQPVPESEGVYPIPLLSGDGPAPGDCGGTRYRLPFEARSTYWKYYVVSQRPGALLDLKIEGGGAKFSEQDEPERLPDGSLARLFTTDTRLSLRQKSAERFQLTGCRRDPGGQDNAIVKLRLPVAPAAPVWPVEGDDDSTGGTSEIFVYV